VCRELDLYLLCEPMSQVLYNLFQWPLLKASRLAVIGISNTHDLPDKFLPRIARCAAVLTGIATLCLPLIIPALLLQMQHTPALASTG
jgi:hypothetical protein